MDNYWLAINRVDYIDLYNLKKCISLFRWTYFQIGNWKANGWMLNSYLENLNIKKLYIYVHICIITHSRKCQSDLSITVYTGHVPLFYYLGLTEKISKNWRKKSAIS